MSAPQHMPPLYPPGPPVDPFAPPPIVAAKSSSAAAWVVGAIAAVALVAVLVVGAVAYPVVTRVSGEPTAVAGGGSAPTSAAGAPSVATGFGFRTAKPSPSDTDRRVVVTLFEDLQCPACKQFESMFGEAITTLRANPDVVVEYRMISFLDRASTNNYSSRATNASACVAEATATGGDWSTWLRFHTMLYDEQATEGGAGHTDAALASLAVGAGSPDVSSCIINNLYASWIQAGTRDALDAITGTPTVQIDGVAVDLSTPSELVSAVERAVA